MTSKLRIFGVLILLFNLWLVGHYKITGLPLFMLTVGFAIGFELLVVRKSLPAINAEEKLPSAESATTVTDSFIHVWNARTYAAASFWLIAFVGVVAYLMFANKPSNFEDCVLERMKNQSPSMRLIAFRACAHLPKNAEASAPPAPQLLQDFEIWRNEQEAGR